MNRQQAVNYLKDLLNVCNDISPDCVSLENLQTDPPNTRIHIRGNIQEPHKQKVKTVAKENHLDVQETENGIIIYAPQIPLSETLKLVTAPRTNIELNTER